MLLTISTTHRPATDLGYLLHKHPDNVRTVSFPFGDAHVAFPQADDWAEPVLGRAPHHRRAPGRPPDAPGRPPAGPEYLRLVYAAPRLGRRPLEGERVDLRLSAVFRASAVAGAVSPGGAGEALGDGR